MHREAVETFCRLAFDFWEFCRGHGYAFGEAAPLAYVTHMLCGDPFAHTLDVTAGLWAPDWTGCYRDRLPDGRPWHFEDHFGGQARLVDPAVVHAMHSKGALVAEARRFRAGGAAGPGWYT